MIFDIFRGYVQFSFSATWGVGSRKIWMTMNGFNIFALMSLIFLGGCSSPAISDGPAPTSPVAISKEEPIRLAPSTEANNIAEWVETGVFVNSKVYSMKSVEHANAYWAAARLHGPGFNNTWAVFGRGGTFIRRNDASMTAAADGIAREFSDAPDGCADKSGLCSKTSDEPDRLLEFVKALQPNDSEFAKGATLVPGRSKPKR